MSKDGWTIPKLWPESTIFILGGGPSLNDVNFDLIKSKKVIAVNNAYGDPVHENEKLRKYTPRPWVDVCYFGDERWYDWHKKYLKDFTGLLVTTRDKFHGRAGMYGVKRGKPEGIDERPSRISWNRSSGASAINLAYHLGARKIVLLGFDMRLIDGAANWHNDHRVVIKDPYARFLKPFTIIARDAKKLNLQIINATENSALTHFPYVSLEEILKNENEE